MDAAHQEVSARQNFKKISDKDSGSATSFSAARDKEKAEADAGGTGFDNNNVCVGLCVPE